MYVNYGRVDDFKQLKKLGVNVTGKIAIMRYGKIYRGNKVTPELPKILVHARGVYHGVLFDI